jgi:hypothetical protein
MREMTRSGPRVGVGVGAAVSVGVGEDVEVGVGVAVAVGVGVSVGVGVRVWVAVAVGVAVGAGVEVDEGFRAGSRRAMVWGELQAATIEPKPASRKKARRVNGRRSVVGAIERETLFWPAGDSDHSFAVACEFFQIIGAVDGFNLEASVAEEQFEFVAKEVPNGKRK